MKDQSWLEIFGVPESVEIEKYGIVTSIFADYEWALEIKFRVTPRRWTDIPVDAGTARVISNGMNIHYDPENLLFRAAQAVESNYPF